MAIERSLGPCRKATIQGSPSSSSPRPHPPPLHPVLEIKPKRKLRRVQLTVPEAPIQRLRTESLKCRLRNFQRLLDTKPAGSAQGMLPALARQATPSHASGHRPQSAARSSIPMQPLKRNRCMPSVRLSSHQPTDFAIDNRPTCC